MRKNMLPLRWLRASALAVALLGFCMHPQALLGQAPTEFRAHLSLVPVDGAGARRTTGMGEAQATLNGTALELTGSFRGLASPATSAELHEGAPGFRGPSFHALELSGETVGSIGGRIELTDAQVQSIQRGHFYIQVYTETNPEGAIRGWLFPQEGEQ